ncbi:MAG TPA: helix-turn-helix transcriptional regulator [Acidimicrobiales bacterium]|nr:helix-turn-helix transcriptional regulator [Acidimicrobiales bacterium]
MIFAQTLRSRREELRLNQRDLAGRLGVKQQTVSRWESGIAVPRPDRVTQLAGVLGVDRGRLLQLAGYLAEDEPLADPDVAKVLGTVRQLSDKDLVHVLDTAWQEHRRRQGLPIADGDEPWRADGNGSRPS